MKLILLLVVFYSATGSAQQVTEKQHPTDIALANCLAICENQTTAGMSQCVIDAHVAWDKEMNKYYKLLMADSQKQWIIS